MISRISLRINKGEMDESKSGKVYAHGNGLQSERTNGLASERTNGLHSERMSEVSEKSNECL
jgi:hypothetical protein